MSRLPNATGYDSIGIKKINSFETLREWLERHLDQMELLYRLSHGDITGSTAAETPNWKVREATAADVTAGNAHVAGNLIVIHKTSGTKHEFQA
jgi:hypothetical protein